MNVTDPLDFVQVQLPFSIEFDVNRTYYSSANYFNVRIYNLAPITRNKLRQDTISYQFGDVQQYYRQISLSAGYGAQLPQILKGNVTRAWSYRQGVDFITELTGLDAGFAFANGVTAAEYTAGTLRQQILQDMVGSLPQTSVGCISQSVVQGSTSKGNSFNGNTCDLLGEYTGGAFFVDNGTVHVLGNNEVTDDEVIVINDQAGLLGTPLLENSIVHLNVIFDPRIKCGQQITIQSQTAPIFNGDYKVISIHHRGMISETICGEVITTLGLVKGSWTTVPRAAQ